MPNSEKESDSCEIYELKCGNSDVEPVTLLHAHVHLSSIDLKGSEKLARNRESLSFSDSQLPLIKSSDVKNANAEKNVASARFLRRLCFGVGHVLNDLCASMWFSHLLVFLQKVVNFKAVPAGVLLLIGQIVDGLATPIVGIESDRTPYLRYGRRKVWHLGGCIAVALTFPFIFNLCITCEDSPHWTLFIYYIPFIIIFQIGWASTQISHLSLIPELASNSGEKVALNAIRYGFTIFSNIFVYAVFWLIFEFNSTPGSLGREDAPKFTKLVLIIVPVGILFSIIFHLGVKENQAGESNEESFARQSCQKLKKTTWTSWFREVQFWQIGMIYMMTRLVVNISQVYIPLYVTDSLFLDKKSIAIIPLVIYVSGISATAFAKPLSSFCGLKITYMIASIMIIAACFWLWAIGGLPAKDRQQIYGASIILGIGSTTLLITSLAMTAELVGDNTCTSAFIYGAMSFFDKVANGIAVMLIQKFHPGTDATAGGASRCPTCAHYYRMVMTFVPGGAAVVALIVLSTLAKSKIGSKKRAKPECVPSPVCPSVNYGSTNPCDKTVNNIYGVLKCDCKLPNCECASANNVPAVGYAEPAGRELGRCAENCKCKLCVNERELDVCAEDCRCRICTENEAASSENESINSSYADKALIKNL